MPEISAGTQALIEDLQKEIKKLRHDVELCTKGRALARRIAEKACDFIGKKYLVCPYNMYVWKHPDTCAIACEDNRDNARECWLLYFKELVK